MCFQILNRMLKMTETEHTCQAWWRQTLGCYFVAMLKVLKSMTSMNTTSLVSRLDGVGR